MVYLYYYRILHKKVFFSSKLKIICEDNVQKYKIVVRTERMVQVKLFLV